MCCNILIQFSYFHWVFALIATLYEDKNALFCVCLVLLSNQVYIPSCIFSTLCLLFPFPLVEAVIYCFRSPSGRRMGRWGVISSKERGNGGRFHVRWTLSEETEDQQCLPGTTHCTTIINSTSSEEWTQYELGPDRGILGFVGVYVWKRYYLITRHTLLNYVDILKVIHHQLLVKQQNLFLHKLLQPER